MCISYMLYVNVYIIYVICKCVPYLGLYNAHLLLALKISRKKLFRVYNAHGLLKKSPSEM